MRLLLWCHYCYSTSICTHMNMHVVSTKSLSCFLRGCVSFCAASQLMSFQMDEGGWGVVLLRKNCLMEDIGVLQKGGVKCFGMLYTLAMGMEIMK